MLKCRNRAGDRTSVISPSIRKFFNFWKDYPDVFPLNPLEIFSKANPALPEMRLVEKKDNKYPPILFIV